MFNKIVWKSWNVFETCQTFRKMFGTNLDTGQLQYISYTYVWGILYIGVHIFIFTIILNHSFNYIT